MHLILCAAGTVGDVHPLLAVAVAMRGRGHRVTLLANAAYETVAREAGAEFAPVGRAEDLERMQKDPQGWTYADGWKRWLHHSGVEPMRDLYAAIRDHYEPGSTVVAASYLTLGARVAQDHLGIPTATLHLNPHTIRTVHDIHVMPPPMMLWKWLPRWFVRLEYRLADRFWIDPVVLPELNAFRRELGLLSVSRVMNGWWHSPQLAIGLFPDWWYARQPDWPPQVELTGFPFWDRSDTVPVPAELNAFLDAGSPPILFTPGASGLHTRDYFAAACGACEQLGRRGLLITRRTDVLPAELPPFMRSVSYVPFRKVLSRMAAVVHHAGIGTTALCLEAGVPQLVLPSIYNQPDTACRLERLGVARQLHPQQLSTARMATLLNKLISSPDIADRCRVVASRFRGVDPLPRVCDLLEGLLGR
jgi:rhamnosyltransferase subunit B